MGGAWGWWPERDGRCVGLEGMTDKSEGRVRALSMVKLLAFTAHKVGSHGALFSKGGMQLHRSLQRVTLAAVLRAGSRGQGHKQGGQLGG